MSFILIAAGCLALGTMQWIDAGVIFSIVGINTIIGTIQGTIYVQLN